MESCNESGNATNESLSCKGEKVTKILEDKMEKYQIMQDILVVWQVVWSSQYFTICYIIFIINER